MDKTGLYRISRDGAPSFAAALKRAGRYQIAEPDALATRQAFPADPLTQYQWAYNGWVRTVKTNRGRIAYSYRSGRAQDSVVIYTTSRRRQGIYLSVWSRSLDAGYRMIVKRASYRRGRFG
jgi:hypothetical protein